MFILYASLKRVWVGFVHCSSKFGFGFLALHTDWIGIESTKQTKWCVSIKVFSNLSVEYLVNLDMEQVH